MTAIERLKTLPIYARTFLLLTAAVLTADLVTWHFLPGSSAPRPPPVRIEDIARALGDRGDDHPPPDRPPPGEDRGGGPPGSPDMREPGVGAPGPGPPRSRPHGFAAFTSRDRPSPPAGQELAPSPMLAKQLANRLTRPANAVMAYASHPNQSTFNDASDRAVIDGDVWVSVQSSEGLWRSIDLKRPGTVSEPRFRIDRVLALEALVLLPLGWLFASTLASPLRRFTQAAKSAGNDSSSGPVPREGPTEMVAAIDAFNAMQGRLKRLLHERTQMVGAIAHDLRTPLTRLAFRLDDLPGPAGEKVRQDIDEMKTMISAALDFIRDQSLQGQYERLEFRSLIERVVEEQSDLGHDVTLSPGGAVTIEGAPLALRRVVANLVDNAVKYGERARLSLSVQGTHCALEVDDDGPGIPVALQLQVFDPFFRIEGSRNRDSGGIGLGLAAVRTIVLEHGGDVSLSNRKQGGLRVTMILPVSS